MLATLGELKTTDFLRELLYRIKICDFSGKNIETLQKSI